MRLIVKVGTRVLCRPDGVGLDRSSIARLSSALIELVRAGHEVLLVSSGAVGAGLMEVGRRERPADTPTLQALAAVGQGRLIREYAQAMEVEGFCPAQLLLTYGDLEGPERSGRVREAIRAIWALGSTIPVLNENDSVAVEELRFGDNDRLSASVAGFLQADLLVLLTSVDGFLVPSGDGAQQLLRCVEDIASLRQHVGEHADPLSRGGMNSKLDAVELALDAGVECAIAHGHHPQRLKALVDGEEVVATRFPLRAQRTR